MGLMTLPDGCVMPERVHQGETDGLHFWRRPGPGRRLVFLHGIGSRAGSFLPLVPWLPSDWDLLAWDAPGYGASTPLPMDWPVEADYARALLRLLDGLAGGAASHEVPVTLIGHSLGTLMAAAFAADHPDRVAALVLAATTCGHAAPVGGPLGPSAQARLEAFAASSAEDFAAARAPRLLGNPANAEALARVQGAMASARMPGYGQAVRMLASGRIEPLLVQISCPVTFIWGTADVVTPRTQTERARAVLAKVKGESPPLIEIPGIGHALHAEEPQAFAVALRGSLTSENDRPGKAPEQ